MLCGGRVAEKQLTPEPSWCFLHYAVGNCKRQDRVSEGEIEDKHGDAMKIQNGINI
jgi:hypothetical protein